MKTAQLFKALGDSPAAQDIPCSLVRHANRNRPRAGHAPHQEGQRTLAILDGVAQVFIKA